MNNRKRDYVELKKQIVDKTMYYKSECDKLEATFARLHLLSGTVCRKQFEDLRDQTSEMQEKLDAVEFSTNCLFLSASDIARKQANYMAKLKICTKTYFEFNSILFKKVATLKKEYEESGNISENILTLSAEDIKVMEEKIRRYENELVKLERKHPWLKDSSFHIDNLTRKISLLTKLQELKNELVEEISRYHGLKPNLVEAARQLADIKAEHDELSRKILEKK